MLAKPAESEFGGDGKIVILPVCWEQDALRRLGRTLDPETVRLHRAQLRASIEEDIRLATLAATLEAELAQGRAEAFDAVARKHLDILLDVLQAFTSILKDIE